MKVSIRFLVGLISFVDCHLFDSGIVNELKTGPDLSTITNAMPKTNSGLCSGRIVLFYKSTCPACRRFARTYTYTQKLLNEHELPLQLHAFDCKARPQASPSLRHGLSSSIPRPNIAINSSVDVCSNFTLESVPTLSLITTDASCFASHNLHEIQNSYLSRDLTVYALPHKSDDSAADIIKELQKLKIIPDDDMRDDSQTAIAQLDALIPKPIEATFTASCDSDSSFLDALNGFAHITNVWLPYGYDAKPEKLKSIVPRFSYLLDLVSGNDTLSQVLEARSVRQQIESLQTALPVAEKLSSFNCTQTATGTVWIAMHTVAQQLHNIQRSYGSTSVSFADAIANVTSAALPSSLEIAEFFRDLVATAFPCSPCVVHFTELYDELIGDLKGADQESQYAALTLWLWRFHNVVRIRTGIEETASKLITSNFDAETLWHDPRFAREALISSTVSITPELVKKMLLKEKISISSLDHPEDFDMSVISKLLDNHYTI